MIRLAVPGDAARLAELHRAVFPDGAWDASFWKGATASAFDSVFLLGEPPRAFAALRHTGDDAEVLTIGTTTPQQGDGLSLMRAILTVATAAGAQRLFLEVSTANKAALRLYKTCGFDTEGRRKAYYRDGSDALVLRRNLARGE